MILEVKPEHILPVKKAIHEIKYGILLNVDIKKYFDVKEKLKEEHIDDWLYNFLLNEKYIVEQWYVGHSDCGWYNSHLSKQKIYSGYWCFEGGAIAKVLGLDDSRLKNQQYYPYDLVHYKE